MTGRATSTACLVVAVLAAIGCTCDRTAAPSANNRESAAPVFLTSAKGLRPSPDHPGRWYDLSRRLADYHSFIVEEPQILFDKTRRGEPITPAERDALARAYQDEFAAILSTRYIVTQTPGPGVAIIRSAITQVARSIDPASGARQEGGASREMEIIDSISGERLAMVIEREHGQDEHEPLPDRPFHDARASFKHWASRLDIMLRDTHRLATRP